MENDDELEINELGTELDEEVNEDVDTKDKDDKESGKKTYDDEEVDDIIKKKVARLEKRHQKELEKAQKAAEKDGDVDEAEQLRQRLDEYEQRETRREREGDVRNVFKDASIDVPDSLVAALIRDDEEESQDAAEAVIELVKQEVQKVKKLQGRRTPPADPSASKKSTEDNLGKRLAKKNTSKNGKAF